MTPTHQNHTCVALSHDHALEAGHVALLGGDFKVAVDDGDSKEDTGTTAESTEEIATDGKSSDAGSTEGGSRGDNTLELLVHRLLTMAGHDETLLLELLGDVAGRGAGNLDPGLRKDSARDKHVYDEDGRLEGIGEGFGNAERGRPVFVSVRSGREIARLVTPTD